MALTKLNVFKDRSIKKRALEPEDIRQAFLRSAKEKWGECPLEVKSVKSGTVRITAPSAPWRTEMLWSRQEMIEKINASLGEEVCKKITVWWE